MKKFIPATLGREACSVLQVLLDFEARKGEPVI